MTTVSRWRRDQALTLNTVNSVKRSETFIQTDIFSSKFFLINYLIWFQFSLIPAIFKPLANTVRLACNFVPRAVPRFHNFLLLLVFLFKLHFKHLFTPFRKVVTKNINYYWLFRIILNRSKFASSTLKKAMKRASRRSYQSWVTHFVIWWSNPTSKSTHFPMTSKSTVTEAICALRPTPTGAFPLRIRWTMSLKLLFGKLCAASPVIHCWSMWLMLSYGKHLNSVLKNA